MSLTSTMAYALLILSILSIIVDVKTIIPHTQLKTSTVSLNESSTEYDYSQTTKDTVKAVNNSRLYNTSKFEGVTQSPPHFDSLPLIRTSTEFTLLVENTSDALPEENCTSTTMSTTTYSADIENGNHDMPNEEEVAHSLLEFNKKTLLRVPDLFLVQIENVEFNTFEETLEENSTSTTMSTTTYSADIENGNHDMPNEEEVAHSLLEFNKKTLLRVPDLFLVQIENVEFNTFEETLEENSTSTTMSTTTYSADIENGNHDMPNEEEVTQSPPHFDSLPLIRTSTEFTLLVENYEFNTSDASPTEKSTYVNPSTTMQSTTDSVDIENDPHNMSNQEEVLPVGTHEFNDTSDTLLKKNNTDIDSSSTTITKSVTHNLSAVDGTNILPLVIKTHIINNTSSKPLTKNNTRIHPSKVILTTDSTDTEIPPFNMSNYKDVCGRQLIKMARIVGGNKVSFGEWPWQISLRHQKQSIHKCGAVLINENWAITTAHCVINVPVTDIHLVFGKYNFLVKDEPYGNVTRKLQTVITHPKFKSNETNYDLALLKFDKPVKFQPNILPVCIPEDDFNFVGYSARVTGWGTLYYGGHWPTILQAVTVPVVSNSVCERMFLAAGYVKKIPDTFICAGTEKGGFDACKGDSGGPMVVQRPDKRWLVAGITSWGMRCGEPNSPGVYMRISKFKDWINQIILQF
ncbi:serine proteinase stubble-like isoform X2 [Aphis gossypii]|uniref:serine proteinase stubble-like isoform X2 n=1 Tax=Aphis gossypii TaxID=80765 RepID=UPI002159AE8A|nr:serine proteinase stubble-like isoform X2 [Aphis gossypii]